VEVSLQLVDGCVVLGDLARQLRHLPLVLFLRLRKLAAPNLFGTFVIS
jgi:hypothetical protein